MTRSCKGQNLWVIGAAPVAGSPVCLLWLDSAFLFLIPISVGNKINSYLTFLSSWLIIFVLKCVNPDIWEDHLVYPCVTPHTVHHVLHVQSGPGRCWDIELDMQPVWPKLVQKFRSQSSSWLKPEKLTQLQGESREHTPTLWDPSHLSQSIVPIDSSPHPHPSSFRNLSLGRGGRGGRRVGDNKKQSSFPVVAVVIVVVVVVVVVSVFVIICLSLKFFFFLDFCKLPAGSLLEKGMSCHFHGLSLAIKVYSSYKWHDQTEFTHLNVNPYNFASFTFQIENPNTSAILRQSSAAYIASFIARSKFIPVRYSMLNRKGQIHVKSCTFTNLAWFNIS